MKRFYFILSLFLIYSNIKGQNLDTTFVLDAKKDVIFLDGLQEVRQYRHLEMDTTTYIVTVSGVARFKANDQMNGVICLLSEEKNLGLGKFVIIEVGDTLRFKAGHPYISFFIVDHATTADNSGTLKVHLAKDAKTSVQSNNMEMIRKSYLSQNYPNPFNPETIIHYSIQKSGYTQIKIYNNLGQLIRTLINEYKNQGDYSVYWDGTNDYGKPVTSGTYLYQLCVGDFVSNKKMLLLR